MTAETGLTSRQKLDLVQRIGALGLNAQTLIVNDKRSGSDVETLLRALQAFKENRLGGIIFSERTFNLASLAACSIEVVSLPFEKEDQKWMRLRGVRYVGEIYYVHFDAKSSYSVARGKRVLSFLEGRFSLPMNMDPLALGWKPPYWNSMTKADLSRLILNEMPTPPEPNWDEVSELINGPWYRRQGFKHRPMYRGIARLLHQRGAHFIVDIFLTTYPSQNCPANKRSSGMLKSLMSDLRACGSTMWAGALVPPMPRAPWESRWKDELAAIEEETAAFSAAIEARKAAEKVRREEEEARREQAHLELATVARTTDILNREIDFIELGDEWSVRTINCLQNSNIRLYGELVVHDRVELRRTVDNLGMKSIREIEEHLATLGLKLGMTDRKSVV